MPMSVCLLISALLASPPTLQATFYNTTQRQTCGNLQFNLLNQQRSTPGPDVAGLISCLFASGSLFRPVWRHHHSCSKPHSESEGLAPTRAIGLISATHQFPFCSVRLKVLLGCHSGKQYSVNYPPKERPFGQLNHFY